MSRWSLKDNIPFVLHDLPFPNRYTKKKRKQRSLPQPPWHPMSVHKLYGNPTDSEEHGCLARASQHSAPLCGSVKIPNKQHLCRRGSEQNERDQEVKPISSLSSTACHWSSAKPEESLACTSQLRRESSLVFLSHCKLTDFHEQNASGPNAQLRERQHDVFVYGAYIPNVYTSGTDGVEGTDRPGTEGTHPSAIQCSSWREDICNRMHKLSKSFKARSPNKIYASFPNSKFFDFVHILGAQSDFFSRSRWGC